MMEKRFREHITIILIASILLAISWQVYEMVRVYGPIADQADAAKKYADTTSLAQRAWVGPVDANLTGGLTVGQGVKIDIQYGNTGREPGVQFVAIGTFKVFPLAEWNNGAAAASIAQTGKDCMASRMTVEAPTQVAFPSAGFASYHMHVDSASEGTPAGERITASDTLVKGDEIIAFRGCFTYHSIFQLHHTAFCFFYKAKDSDAAHLSICTVGSGAD
jgi:hypothetical protein